MNIDLSRMPFTSVCTALAISLSFIVGGVHAEQLKMFGDEPDPQELADFLFPAQSSSDATRSWLADDERAPANVAALKILFEFDSSEIKPESLETVGRLAQALLTAGAADKPVLIEGHTDATGESYYNQSLSVRRAQAVKDYLVDIYQIAAERMQVEGRGESQLLNDKFPASAINRRVQVKQLLARQP